MQFEWTVVLVAAAVIAIFVIWVAGRPDSPDQKRPDASRLHGQEQTGAPTQKTINPGRPLPQSPPVQAKTPTEPVPPSTIRSVKKFHAQLLTDTAGAPISSSNRSAWLEARRFGVTATDVGKIVKLDGKFSSQRSGLMEAKLSGREPLFQHVMQHGVDREPVIAVWVAEQFGIQPNNLICRGDNHRHLATPDGIGPGLVAEIKTSIKPLAQTLGIYRDQLQWQLHVTGSERLLFVVENRKTLRRETMWVERDECRIFILTQHADAFVLEMDQLRATSAAAGAEPKKQPVELSTAKVPPPVQSDLPVSLHVAALATAPSRTTAVGVDQDETHIWTETERSTLLSGYAGGASIAMLGLNSGATHRSVVFELSRLLLNPNGPMVNPAAERFGYRWESGEERLLHELYSAGTSLPDIASEMKRDQLGVAFRLFENHIPQLPALQVSPITPLPSPLGTAGTAEPAVATSPDKEPPVTPDSGDLEQTGEPGAAHFLSLPVVMRLNYKPLPPETIVGSLDPDNDSEDNRSWTQDELKRLLSIYSDNEDLELFEIARRFSTTSRSVVIALTHLLLEPRGPLEDQACPKHRQLWTQGEVDEVHDSFRSGATLYQIARALGRDQLSVAFRLFSERLPEASALPEELRFV